MRRPRGVDPGVSSKQRLEDMRSELFRHSWSVPPRVTHQTLRSTAARHGDSEFHPTTISSGTRHNPSIARTNSQDKEDDEQGRRPEQVARAFWPPIGGSAARRAVTLVGQFGTLKQVYAALHTSLGSAMLVSFLNMLMAAKMSSSKDTTTTPPSQLFGRTGNVLKGLFAPPR